MRIPIFLSPAYLSSVLRDYVKNAFNVKGFTSRADFIAVIGIYVILFLLIAYISAILAIHVSGMQWAIYLPDVFAAVTVIPNISMLIRRIRDTDNSLWWLLAYAIPVIGIFMVLTVALMPGRTPDGVRKMTI